MKKKMNKKTYAYSKFFYFSLIALAILLILSVILAPHVKGAELEITVDCDTSVWWNTKLCRDFELQDEFNDVADYINEFYDDYITEISRVQEDLARLGRWNQVQQRNINGLWDNQGELAKWLNIVDNRSTGNDGRIGNLENNGKFSRQDLGKYITGDIWFFYDWKGSFLDWLLEVFATKNDLYELEAKCYLGKGAGERDIAIEAAKIKAAAVGHEVPVPKYNRICSASLCRVAN